MRRPSRLLLGVLLSALLAVAGCAGARDEATDTLTYTLPIHLVVEEGSFLPGTDVRYLGRVTQGAHVLVAGQDAWKRTGDSLDWSGEMLPGAAVRLNTRVISYSDAVLRVAGTVNVAISGADPRAAVVDREAPVRFSGLAGYSVAAGELLPGSTVRYVGPTPEGAEIGGLDGYPYRKAGDSVVWEGTLAEGVSIELQMRVVQYDEAHLRVAGLVTLWLAGEESA